MKGVVAMPRVTFILLAIRQDIRAGMVGSMSRDIRLHYIIGRYHGCRVL